MPLLKAIYQPYLLFLFLYSTHLSAQNDIRMLFKEPADNYHSSSPLGNGRLGAMVFGQVQVERIQLNEKTLWSGEPFSADNPAAGAALPEIQKLLFQGRYIEAEKLTNEAFCCVGEDFNCDKGAETG